MLANPFRTLIVDDDTDLLEELSEGLRLEGLAVSTCTSGQQALQLIATQPDIRVLVTDLAMPEMGGIELLRRLATRKVSPGVKAIVEQKLESAKTATRVSAFKAEKALESVNVSAAG